MEEYYKLLPFIAIVVFLLSMYVFANVHAYKDNREYFDNCRELMKDSANSTYQRCYEERGCYIDCLGPRGLPARPLLSIPEMAEILTEKFFGADKFYVAVCEDSIGCVNRKHEVLFE